MDPIGCGVAAGPANGSGEGGEALAGAVDTTGAGDAFAAGFLAARLNGAGPTAALVAGCRLAGDAIRSPGARPVAC
jgi:sugar/nucleoside kinase (ribokinase family)